MGRDLATAEDDVDAGYAPSAYYLGLVSEPGNGTELEYAEAVR